MAKARVAGITSEVEQYRQTRYISAAEATWRILGFHVLDRYPAVTRIHAHLEGEHNVIFPENATPEQRQQAADESVSDLMRYFNRPLAHIFHELTLLDYFEQYVITKKKKDDPIPEHASPGTWLDHYGNTVSSRATGSHVCRLIFQSPAVGDLYYLRLLLHKIPARTLLRLKTVHTSSSEPVVYPTFHDAARAQGIITGDEEYFICMTEAATFQMGHQLRGLFVTLILDGGPAPKLWNDFKENLIEDLLSSMTEEDAVQKALCIIDLKLQLHGKTNTTLDLPAARHNKIEYERMKDAFKPDEQTDFANAHEPLLTPEQLQVYNAVINAVNNNQPQPFMIDAPAGTGKTFTEKVIAARLRGQGKVVLIVASTGIAALQLPGGGWTAHSMFKLPMNEYVVSGAVCNINSETQRAELIRKCDLIIFDELPMMHKYCIEAIEITLRDLMNTSDLFGGKTCLFSGDWRQCPPIVEFGSQSDTVHAAFISSHLWEHINRMRLTVSQRDKGDAAYASYVRTIGENRQTNSTFPDGSKLAPLSNRNEQNSNDQFDIQYTTDFDKLVDFVYPDVNEDTRLLHDRAILATTNASIDTSNDHIANARPGNSVTFFSSDSLIKDDENRNTSFASPEHLNEINVQGVPPQALTQIRRSVNDNEKFKFLRRTR